MGTPILSVNLMNTPCGFNHAIILIIGISFFFLYDHLLDCKNHNYLFNDDDNHDNGATVMSLSSITRGQVVL